MQTLLIILVVLFISLAVFIPLLEKYTREKGEIKAGRLSQYIFPLIAVMLVLALLRHFMG